MNIMNKRIFTAFLTAFFFVLSFVVTAQTNSPNASGTTPDNPENGDQPDSGNEVGNGAPIGGGTLILIALGAAYGGRKVYTIVKDNHEELES